MNECAFSQSRQYRYSLVHRWNGEGEPVNAVVWIGLRAFRGGDENGLDKELRQVKRLSESLGYNAFLSLNLFAWTEGGAKDWMTARNPVGFENDAVITKHLANYARVIVAWGTVKGYRSRVPQMMKILKAANVEVFCVGVNGDGSPKQPLSVHEEPFIQPYKI